MAKDNEATEKPVGILRETTNLAKVGVEGSKRFARSRLFLGK